MFVMFFYNRKPCIGCINVVASTVMKSPTQTSKSACVPDPLTLLMTVMFIDQPYVLS